MEATQEEAKQVREALLSASLRPPIVSCEVRPYLPGMASTLFIAELHEAQPDTEPKTHSAVVKILPPIKAVREMQASEEQFVNEAWMFNKVIPTFLKKYETDSSVSFFPTCFYASCDDESSMIVVENLEVSGFKLSVDKAMDYDHCVLALKTLARFHAYSYAMKKTDPKYFRQHVAGPWQEVRFVPNSKYSTFIKFVTKRVALVSVNRFLTIYPELAEKHKVSLQKLIVIIENVFDSFSDLVTPNEPFSVLCHGDFNRNNMLFHYGDDGKPDQVKLIDFQTIRYASPAIDISFFFYLNTTPELRQRFEGDLLSRYHEAVLESLAEMLSCTVEELRPEFPFQRFMDDYARHAVYGYLIAVEFIHMVYATDEEVASAVDLFCNDNPTQEVVDSITSLGGEVVVQMTAAMVKQLLENGYIT